VLEPDVYDPALNPLYRDFLAHHGVVALAARVAAGSIATGEDVVSNGQRMADLDRRGRAVGRHGVELDEDARRGLRGERHGETSADPRHEHPVRIGVDDAQGSGVP